MPDPAGPPSPTLSGRGATPAVTVVIPAYNRAGSIRAAIDSVLRQTFADFELVVVDDGSTDGTAEAVAAINDPRLRLIATPRNMGAAGARNTGVAAARGQWIAFQDSDDEWLPLKLEKQMARLPAPGPDGKAFVAAYCGLLTLGGLDDAPGARLALRYVPYPDIARVEGDMLATLLGRSLISTQTLVVRADVIRALGAFDEATTPIEDWDFVIRLAQKGPIACVDEPLVHQRFSPDSITRRVAERAVSKARVIEKNMDAFARHPKLLAKRYDEVAGDLRRVGRIGEAAQYTALARAAGPGDPRRWAKSAWLAARRLLGSR